ncbi:hypothetical protein QJQ45_001385 [Haematococcus lacustris]|nr:hypothetical protein QJQ45_001385 [Haematococcus lacustris]
MSQNALLHSQANKNVTDPSAIEHHLLEAREATQFIRENIVQAHKTSCGTFAVRPEAAQQLQDMNRSHGQESGGGSPLG